MHKLILLSVLLLTACKPMDYGVRFDAKDIVKACTDAGGVVDRSSVQIGVIKSLFGDSMTISYTCIKE